METRVMTAHVPMPLAKRVDALAEQMERSSGWIIEQALTAWVEEEELRRQHLLAAIAEVEAGRFVEDDVVKAWIDGLEQPAPAARS